MHVFQTEIQTATIVSMSKWKLTFMWVAYKSSKRNILDVIIKSRFLHTKQVELPAAFYFK